MKLFEVRNGWMGESYSKVFVIAATMARAIEVARDEYKKEAMQVDMLGRRRYPDSYYEDLKAVELCADTAAEWATAPRDH